MKKIITLLVFVVCITMLYAQDIIITKDSKRIEAKIIEVTPTTVKYKKWSYQDGPDILEAKSNIAAIMWGNGEVEAFSVEEVVLTTKEEDKQEVVVKEESNMEKMAFSVLVKDLPYISKVGNTYKTSDGNYLSGKELEYYLEKNCRGAYDVWVSGVLTRTAGWTLFGCGLCLDLISAISYGVMGGYTPTSLACSITGGLCEIACIPTLIVGYAKKNKAINYYNSYCTKQNTSVTLNFGVASNQIGFVLSF